MTLPPAVSLALVVAVLSSCTSTTDVAPRPLRRVVPPSYQTTRGTGEVGHVRDPGIAALREGHYQCSEIGGPLRSGVTVHGRVLAVDIAGQVIRIRTTVVDDSLAHGEVVFGAGRYRTLMTAGEPLVGEDTLALALLIAAATVDCGVGGR